MPFANPTDVMPDAEMIAARIIRTGTGGRTYSSIPKKPTYPLMTVQRLGGLPRTRRLDAANIQIDVWGTTKSEARLLASQARKYLHEAEGTSWDLPTGDIFITGVEDWTGLTWLPDPSVGGNQGRDRYLFGVTLFLHGDQGLVQSGFGYGSGGYGA